MSAGRPDTYDDFVAWRDEHDGEQVTVGDAMRWFTGTPAATILLWWKHDKEQQESIQVATGTQAAYQHARESAEG